MSDLWTQIRNVALTVTVLSAVFFVLSIGVGETYSVIVEPTDSDTGISNLNMSTLDAYGGSVDFVERIGTLGMVVIALGPAGLAAIKARGNGSKLIDQTVQYALPIVALIAAVNSTDMIMEIISGDRVWDNFTDSQNSWALGNAAAVVAGITGWLRMRN